MSNDEIFAAAYREHYWAVSRYVARRLPGQSDEVEEVVAEVFTTAWRRRRDLPDAPLPWLYGVARNCLANAVRGYGRRRRLVDRLGNDDAAHGRHLVDSPDTEPPGAWVHEALDRLSPADREILRLAAWEELDAGQIAVVLGCGRRAATMRLHRARRRLRTEIARLRPTTPAPGSTTGQGPGREAPEDVSALGRGSGAGVSEDVPLPRLRSGARVPEDVSPLGPGSGAGVPEDVPLPGLRPGPGRSEDVPLSGLRPGGVVPEDVSPLGRGSGAGVSEDVPLPRLRSGAGVPEDVSPLGRGSGAGVSEDVPLPRLRSGARVPEDVSPLGPGSGAGVPEGVPLPGLRSGAGVPEDVSFPGLRPSAGAPEAVPRPGHPTHPTHPPTAPADVPLRKDPRHA